MTRIKALLRLMKRKWSNPTQMNQLTDTYDLVDFDHRPYHPWMDENRT